MAVLGTPIATTSCRGTAALADTGCTARAKWIAPRRRHAVVVTLCTLAIAALTAVCIIVGGIMFTLTNAVAARLRTTDLTALVVDLAF